jgi:hypothetical protein
MFAPLLSVGKNVPIGRVVATGLATILPASGVGLAAAGVCSEPSDVLAGSCANAEKERVTSRRATENSGLINYI